MSARPTATPFQRDVALHVFMVSSGLVGVCLTVLGISHAVVRTRALRGFSRDLLAIDALLFLLACVESYLALRSREGWLQNWLSRSADWFFLGGLALMVVVCALIAYTTV
jgi:hypothetical protein